MDNKIIMNILRGVRKLMFDSNTRKDVIKYYRQGRIWLRMTSWVGGGMSYQMYNHIKGQLYSYKLECLKNYGEAKK